MTHCTFKTYTSVLHSVHHSFVRIRQATLSLFLGLGSLSRTTSEPWTKCETIVTLRHLMPALAKGGEKKHTAVNSQAGAGRWVVVSISVAETGVQACGNLVHTLHLSSYIIISCEACTSLLSFPLLPALAELRCRNVVTECRYWNHDLIRFVMRWFSRASIIWFRPTNQSSQFSSCFFLRD